MPSKFTLKTKPEVVECVKAVQNFALDFGLSQHQSELFSLALSEASVNAIRYANGAEVYVDYTANKKGIEVRIEDNGKGIANFEESFEEGYSTSESSLGLGLGAMKRSVDNLIIEKNDATGLCLLLQVFLNTPEYDSASVSVKKDGEEFNGDNCLIHHYDGDSSLFAVIDGAGSGLKAYKASEFISNLLVNNASLDLEELLVLCHSSLQSSELSRAVEIAIIRLKGSSLEYVILGNTAIKSYPEHPFLSQAGSLGLSFPKSLKVDKIEIEKEFCLSLSSDGIDNSFHLYNLYEESSAESLARGIFNNYNIDDDSSVIVVKR